MPPPGMAGAFSWGLSTITHSAVRNRAAIEAAFCSAERVTLAASMTPAADRGSDAARGAGGRDGVGGAVRRGRAGRLGGGEGAGGEQVLVLARGGVEAVGAFQVAHLLDHH